MINLTDINIISYILFFGGVLQLLGGNIYSKILISSGLVTITYVSGLENIIKDTLWFLLNLVLIWDTNKENVFKVLKVIVYYITLSAQSTSMVIVAYFLFFIIRVLENNTNYGKSWRISRSSLVILTLSVVSYCFLFLLGGDGKISTELYTKIVVPIIICIGVCSTVMPIEVDNSRRRMEFLLSESVFYQFAFPYMLLTTSILKQGLLTPIVFDAVMITAIAALVFSVVYSKSRLFYTSNLVRDAASATFLYMIILGQESIGSYCGAAIVLLYVLYEVLSYKFQRKQYFLAVLFILILTFPISPVVLIKLRHLILDNTLGVILSLTFAMIPTLFIPGMIYEYKKI